MHFIENGIEYQLDTQKLYTPGLYARDGCIIFPYYGNMQNWLVPGWYIEPVKIYEMGLCSEQRSPEEIEFFITYESITDVCEDEETGECECDTDIDTAFYDVQEMPEKLRALLAAAAVEYMAHMND